MLPKKGKNSLLFIKFSFFNHKKTFNCIYCINFLCVCGQKKTPCQHCSSLCVYAKTNLQHILPLANSNNLLKFFLIFFTKIVFSNHFPETTMCFLILSTGIKPLLLVVYKKGTQSTVMIKTGLTFFMSLKTGRNSFDSSGQKFMLPTKSVIQLIFTGKSFFYYFFFNISLYHSIPFVCHFIHTSL